MTLMEWLEPLAGTAYNSNIRAWPCFIAHLAVFPLATLTSDGRLRDGRAVASRFVQTRGQDGYRHREMVQPDQGLWFHSAAGRRQRRIRPCLRGRARRLELS